MKIGVSREHAFTGYLCASREDSLHLPLRRQCVTKSRCADSPCSLVCLEPTRRDETLRATRFRSYKWTRKNKNHALCHRRGVRRKIIPKLKISGSLNRKSSIGHTHMGRRTRSSALIHGSQKSFSKLHAHLTSVSRAPCLNIFLTRGVSPSAYNTVGSRIITLYPCVFSVSHNVPKKEAKKNKSQERTIS